MATTVEKVYESYNELSIDDRKVFLERIKEDEIVAYSTSGKALNRAEFIASIDNAIAEMERGNVISHEELLKEIAEW